MTPQQGLQFKNALYAAENTGLQPKSFNGSLREYLLPARAASEFGYSAAFIAVSVACLVALFLMIRLIRKPPDVPDLAQQASADSDAQALRGADLASLYGGKRPASFLRVHWLDLARVAFECPVCSGDSRQVTPAKYCSHLPWRAIVDLARTAPTAPCGPVSSAGW